MVNSTLHFNRETARALKNNDPLAHVYLLQDSYDGAVAEHRMHTEFVTDMGERLENQPFRSTFSFLVHEDEIVYDTGLRYIASLEKSQTAARKDVESGTFGNYHLARQVAFLQQGEKVLEWANDSSDQSHVIAFSLCPPSSELSYAEAIRLSFKPNRMMASVQIHAKSNGIGETVAFSLDGLTLDRLQLLFDRLGIYQKVSITTLEQLSLPIHLDSRESAEDVADRIVRVYDEICQEQDGYLYQQGINIENNIVEANNFVVAHPEAYALYKSVVYEVAASLHGYVTEGLAQTIRQQLVTQYKYKNCLPPEFLLLTEGDYLDEKMAANLIDYLRSKAIPEYLTKKLQVQSIGHTGTQSESYDIGSAGVDASLAGRSYDGACPSSISSASAVEAALQQQAAQLGIYKTTEAYELPPPVLSKGEFDVIPIGSCPMCKAECGTGIRNRRSGVWFCTQAKCAAYSEDVYDFVFGTSQSMRRSSMSGNKKQTEPMPTNHDKDNVILQNTFTEIQDNQNRIWLLKNELYNNLELTSEEKSAITTELVNAHQLQQELLRSAVGSIAIF